MKRLTLNLILLITLLCFAGCKNEDGENANIIKVTYPTSATNWHSGEPGTRIEWSGAVGTSIDCDLYKGDLYLGSYVTGVNNTESEDGVYEYINRTPLADYETGSNYRLKIKDNDGNYGWSANFTITDRNENIGNIEIDTDSGLSWLPGQTDITVTWDVDETTQGDSVSIHVYIYDSYKDIFTDAHSVVPNTGSYTRTSAVPAEWKTQGKYSLRLRITATNGSQNYGYSDNILVQDKQPIIVISEPNSKSVLLREEPATIRWSNAANPVDVYLYEGLYSDPVLLAGGVNAESLDVDFDESWRPSLYYLVKIVDANGDFGWSSYFPIGNIPTDGLAADFVVENGTFIDTVNDVQATGTANIVYDKKDRFEQDNKALYNNILDDSNDDQYLNLTGLNDVLSSLSTDDDNVTLAVWFKSDWRPEGEDKISVIYSISDIHQIDTGLTNDAYLNAIGISETGALCLIDNLYSRVTGVDTHDFKNKVQTIKWGSGYNDNEWHFLVMNLESDGSRKAWVSNNGGSYDGFDYYYANTSPMRWEYVTHISVGLGQPFSSSVTFEDSSYDFSNFHGTMSQIRVYTQSLDSFDAIMLYHVNNYGE